MRKAMSVAIVSLVLGAATGCSTAGYYWQAIGGQMELMHKTRPIPEVISDSATTPQLKAKLQRVVEIRDFASRELSLPDNGSYRRYADLKRPYVVWNVFATPEFSVKPKEWCFPFAGCVGYKGYFHKEGAEKLAAELTKQGYDVYIGGVPAYSTLGWLDDPILNTFIHYPDPEIARLVFHELAHQVAYAKEDSTFNESFAVTVEQDGVHRWVAAHGTPQQQQDFDQAQERRRGFIHLVAKYRERLAELYSQPLPPDAMRKRKRELQDEMRVEYQQIKQAWGGFSGYDWWLSQPLNNAQLASVAIYTQLVPAFQKILLENGADLPRFYAAVKALAKLSKREREAAFARAGGSATDDASSADPDRPNSPR